MKNTIIKSLCALAVVFSAVSCEDYNEQFEGYDPSPEITDVQDINITLEESDYKYIANSSTNKNLATANKLEAELANIATALAFNNEAEVELFMPRFLENEYNSYLTEGSSALVTYNNIEGVELPNYPISEYELTTEDYTAAYGGDAEAALGYFTPSVTADKKLPNILKKSVAEAEAGDYVVAKYMQSDLDPSAGGGSATTPFVTLVGDSFGLPTAAPAGTVTVNEFEFAYDGMYYSSYGSYTLAVNDEASLSNVTELPNLTEIVAYDDYKYFNISIYVGATADDVTKKIEYTQEDGSSDRVFTIPAGNNFFKMVNESEHNAQADKITFKYDGKEMVFEGNTEGFPGSFHSGAITVEDIEFAFDNCYYSSYGSYTIDQNSNGFFANNTELKDLKSVVLTDDYKYFNLSVYFGAAAGEKTTKIEYTKEGNDYIFEAPAGDGFFTIVNESDHGAFCDKITVNYGSVAAGVAKVSAAPYKAASVFVFDGTEWKAPAGVDILSSSDYVAMGSTYGSLSSSQDLAVVMPVYLANKYPFSVDGDKLDVFYNYYDSASKVTAYTVGRYININGTWSNITVTGTTTKQALFNLVGQEWVMNKKCYISLSNNTGMGDYDDKSEDVKTFTVDGATFEYKWAFFASDKASIAIPAGDSYIRNTTAFNGLTQIIVTEDYQYYNLTIGVSATLDGEYTTVEYVKEGNDYIYTVPEGNSFVKIYNLAQYQAYGDVISFEFASLGE